MMRVDRNLFALSDSEDSDDDSLVSISTAYKSLDMKRSLQCPSTYRGAISEIQAIVVALYKHRVFDKQTRALVDDDIRHAIRLLPGGELNRKALQSLMTAVERALPQAKRQALSREYRQRAVEAQRASRRERTAITSNSKTSSKNNASVVVDDAESESDAGPSFADLPKECMEIIFQNLDPIALASAASTCKVWHQLATKSDILWAPLRDLVFGIGAAQEHDPDRTLSVYHSFCILAKQHSEWLLPWKSSRIACHGAVRWIAPQTWQRVVTSPGPAGIAWNKSHGVVFMTPSEVVVWLDRRDGKVLEQIQAQWREREAERLRRRVLKSGSGVGALGALSAPPSRLRFWAAD